LLRLSAGNLIEWNELVTIAMNNARKVRTKYNDRIVRDRQICGGQPVFKGTRVTLRTVLASLADGDPAEVILSDFPTLKPEDICAAIAFAAASAEEDIPVPAIPDVR
jgi:uncharacterized protein (DUF433 family)